MQNCCFPCCYNVFVHMIDFISISFLTSSFVTLDWLPIILYGNIIQNDKIGQWSYCLFSFSSFSLRCNTRDSSLILPHPISHTHPNKKRNCRMLETLWNINLLTPWGPVNINYIILWPRGKLCELELKTGYNRGISSRDHEQSIFFRVWGQDSFRRPWVDNIALEFSCS